MPVGRQGFSLMEVMLVVFILSTTLVVFIQVIANGMSHSMESRDTIIAAGLAQEGVELVKNIRDNNWAKKTDGFLGINPISNGSYVINYNSVALESGAERLKLNGNYYNTSTGSDTKFYRRIDVANGSNANEKKITSMVVWEGDTFPATNSCSAASKCVYAQITLTKWGN